MILTQQVEYTTSSSNNSTALIVLLFLIISLVSFIALLAVGFHLYYKHIYKEPPNKQEIALNKKARTDWANGFYKEAEDRYWQLCHNADDMFRKGEITAVAREQVKKDAKEELTQASKTAFGW